MVVFIKWFGHASFQIKAEGRTIYLDPYAGEYTGKADLILVTHSHHDHFDITKIKKIQKENTVIIAPVDCVSEIDGKVKSLNPNEEIMVDSISVKAVYAYNYKRFRSPGTPYHPKELGVGYLVTVENKIIYHAGDSDFIPEMLELGFVDVALLPSGGTYTMDNEEAIEAALAIKPNTP